jgi:hypothetical protein
MEPGFQGLELGGQIMSLHAKLLEVRKSISYLQKATKNEQQKFDYVSSSQVLGSIREAMNEQGLILRPQVIKAVFHHKGSESMHFTELKMIMTWVDSETGEKESNLWYSQGADQHEKGVGKALTYAEKFFILKYFNIPTDKFDPDAWEEKFGADPEKPKTKTTPKKDPQKAPETSQEAKKDPPPTPSTPPPESGEEKTSEMPTMTGKDFKNHGERIKSFIEVCGQFKKIIGEEAYYKILKANDYDKSNKVRKRDDMNAIYKAFKEEVARQLGGEVVR